MTHVLVATDGSPSARAAVRFTAELLKSVEINHVTLLSVIQASEHLVAGSDAILVPQVTWDSLVAQADAEAVSALDDAQAALHEFAGRITTLRRTGQRTRQILHTAVEIGADLIVLGNSRRSGIRALLGTGDAEAIVRGAQCPVLVVGSTATPISRKQFTRTATRR
jgi:nucleotide-binding universal stress UspA family protein